MIKQTFFYIKIDFSIKKNWKKQEKSPVAFLIGLARDQWTLLSQTRSKCSDRHAWVVNLGGAPRPLGGAPAGSLPLGGTPARSLPLGGTPAGVAETLILDLVLSRNRLE